MSIPEIRIRDQGLVEVCDAFIISFYSNQSIEALMPKARILLQMYCELAGVDALNHTLDEDGYPVEITASSAEELTNYIFELNCDEDWCGFELTGDPDNQTGYRFEMSSEPLPDPNYPELRNWIAMWLPTQLCQKKGWKVIIEFSCQAARVLGDYSFGYGSPCLLYGNDIKPAVGLSRRYPGFDIADGLACRVDVGEKAFGVYWLNFFSPAICAKISARLAELKDANNIKTESISPNQFLLQIGDSPDVGDINRQNNLPQYREVAQLVADDLYVPGNLYMPDESGIGDSDAMNRWHLRHLI